MEHFETVDKWAREKYPEFEWAKFYDLDQFINLNLWHGPNNAYLYLEDNPLEYMPESFESACKELTEMVGEIDTTIWFDTDWDDVLEINPDEDDDNWVDDEFDPDGFGEFNPIYIGPMSVEETTVAKQLLFKEVFSHCV